MTVTKVEYERFMTAVQQQADLPRERAERAIRATLETLAERLSEGEARACGHTAAPFETLRGAFLHEGFLDLTAQLPLEYTAVGALPQRP